MPKTSLDKDLKKVGRLETATTDLARGMALPGMAGVFLAAVAIFVAAFLSEGPLAIYVVVGALIGGYLALNIGANDVANNMGPAVGSKALPMTAALVIAAVCEGAGAMLAGGDVVSTISKSIVTPPADMPAVNFILLMMSAFLSAAIWINLATVLNAPVSTTHSVVGGVLGAGLAAAGASVVSWGTMAAIAASWVISPVMGGVIAAAFLAFVKWSILFREDRVSAARRWVPVLIALMAGVFVLYMLGKGLKKVVDVSDPASLVLAVLAALAMWAVARPWVNRRCRDMDNRRKEVSRLFVAPLIGAAALLSFAHGANDVANAVGPLAAIVAAAKTQMAAPTAVELPIWVLLIGAAGISLGLALFGPRLIRTVGQQITKMDPMRAYCVALSAAITVLIASHLGLPVSSTHIAIGGVFGVGLLREILTNRGLRRRQDREPVPLTEDQINETPEDAVKKLKKQERRRLVRRQHGWTIAAAWVITVPAAGGLAAVLYLGLSLMSRA
ncbi:inorganic phosphate transporter [Euryhalocaulis sp.]|uniref:inorganic phosphate transporter n=1 Tax=Euryhalocaulis sp. TaxID=2744307 RepID=UPI00257B949D|nr:inorganic phosphate transporter [Euryhalocaulis sp.]